MPFDWPTNAYTKTRVKISQILWTLWLDFEGEVSDDTDAVKVLIDAMRGHGLDIPESDVMSYRMILPHLDGGRYGYYINRLIIGQKTKSIKLVSDLPDESHLPDGAGGRSHDERIDRQLFGTAEPARGSTRDNMLSLEPSSRPIDDTPPELAPEESGDAKRVPTPEPARELPRDPVQRVPARGNTRDLPSVQAATSSVVDDQNVSDNLAREDAREFDAAEDDLELDSIGATIQRLDAEAAELFVPVAIEDDAGSHRELLDTIVSLVAELEDRLSVGVGRVEPEGRTEADFEKLRDEVTTLAARLASVLRRAKDAEARLIEKNKEIDGLHLQIRTLIGQNDRLEANNKALMAGERAGGQHIRGAQRFLAEVPSDRPEEGRNRRRTTGAESRLAYSVGPP